MRALTSSNAHTASQGTLRQRFSTHSRTVVQRYYCTTVQLYIKLLSSKGTKQNKAHERKEAASALCSQEIAGERGPASSAMLCRSSAVGPARALVSSLPV